MSKKPICVLFVSNLRDFSGGAQRSLVELITHIDKSKIQPYFASIYDAELAQAIKKLDVPYVKLFPFSKKNPFLFLISNIRLINFIKRNHIDIIHNNRCIDTLYSIFPGKFARIPIIIHHRDSRKLYNFEKFCINHVDCNICISSWQNDEFLSHRAIIIHNGIVINKFIKKPNPSVGDKVRIGLIGRIAPNKGQDVFIKAAKVILQKKSNVRFLIFGDDRGGCYADYFNHLKQSVHEYGLEKYLEFRGYVDSVEKAFNEIDIFVAPSLHAPFGRVILESMASSKPIIATDIGGSLDIFTNEVGILIPPNDYQALAEAICFLLDNPGVREQMGASGRERVYKNFTLDNTLEKLYRIYDQLVTKSPIISL